MRRYGFIKHSLVDYPGEVCSVVFIPGCNFCCPYCHNKTLKQEVAQQGWSLKEIEAYLRDAKSITTAVCITGGEPTLHPETLSFLVDFFRSMGLKIKVDSNGTAPDQLEALNDRVDYFAMDLKTALNRYPELMPQADPQQLMDQIQASMAFLMRRDPHAYEFRTTLAWDFVDEEAIQDLGSRLLKTTRWYFQRCHLPPSVPALDPVKENETIAKCIDLAKKYTNFVFFRE